jgi:thiosulfate/3-mercaptopyruvate sulfurtransferase
MTTSAFGPLVSASWLAQNLEDPSLKIIDFRWYLSGKLGLDEYTQGHIRGAVFVPLESVSAANGPGRHPIASKQQLQDAMRQAGLAQGQRVVVYDDCSGAVAARLWWLLRYYSHANVAVLDGGIQAFARCHGPLERGNAHGPTSSADFVAGEPASDWVVDQQYVQTVIAGRSERSLRAVLLDARIPERYRGDVEPVDARPGHIPTALNAPWTDNLTVTSDGVCKVFKSAQALRTQYEAHGCSADTEVIAYCGSGVTACHDVLAMVVAGLPQPKLYEGSWSDWARNPTRAAVVGER